MIAKVSRSGFGNRMSLIWNASNSRVLTEPTKSCYRRSISRYFVDYLSNYLPYMGDTSDEIDETEIEEIEGGHQALYVWTIAASGQRELEVVLEERCRGECQLPH